MATNWSLAGNGFGNALATGLQLGQGIRQRRLEDEQRATMAQDRAQAKERQSQEDQRSAIPVTLNMLKAATPENWQGLRQRAIQLGIPGAQNAPEQYDQNWIGSTVQQLQAFATPEGQQALTTTAKELVDAGYKYGTPEFQQQLRARLSAGDTKYVPLAPGGGLAGIAPGQAAQLVIAPNTGGMPAGSPAVGGNVPRLTSPDQVRSLSPGSQFYDPNGVLRQVPGGAGGNASGNFP